MEIQRISPATLKTLRAELEAAIANVCNKHGIIPPTLGNIRYTDNSFSTAKLNFNLKTALPKVDISNLNEMIGRRFKMGQRIFNITAVNNGNFSAVSNRGKRYLIKPEQLAGMAEIK